MKKAWIYHLAALLCSSGLARSASAATNGNWVLNGSTVMWDGGTELRIGAGEEVINNTEAQMPTAVVDVLAPTGIQWATPSTTNCPSTNSLFAPANPYYVYWRGSPTPNTFVVTSVFPTEDGLPNGALWWQVGGVCTSHAAANYVYLGAFTTQNGGCCGTISPFERMGDEVLLLNATGPYPNFWAPGMSGPSGAGTITNTNLNIGSNWVFPQSASALLVEMTGTNTDTLEHAVAVYDPRFLDTPTAVQCHSGTQGGNVVELYSIPASGTLPIEQFWWPTSTNLGAQDMWMSICDANWGAGVVTPSLYMRGWREMVHHLDGIRQ